MIMYDDDIVFVHVKNQYFSVIGIWKGYVILLILKIKTLKYCDNACM